MGVAAHETVSRTSEGGKNSIFHWKKIWPLFRKPFGTTPQLPISNGHVLYRDYKFHIQYFPLSWFGQAQRHVLVQDRLCEGNREWLFLKNILHFHKWPDFFIQFSRIWLWLPWTRGAFWLDFILAIKALSYRARTVFSNISQELPIKCRSRSLSSCRWRCWKQLCWDDRDFSDNIQLKSLTAQKLFCAHFERSEREKIAVDPFH